jgi:hypothetical protein
VDPPYQSLSAFLSCRRCVGLGCRGQTHPHTDLNKPAKFHGARANLAGCSNILAEILSPRRIKVSAIANPPPQLSNRDPIITVIIGDCAANSTTGGKNFNSPPSVPRYHTLGASPNLGGHNHGITWANYASDRLVIAHQSKDSPSGRKSSWAGPLPPPCPVRATSLASLISPLRLALVYIRWEGQAAGSPDVDVHPP